MTSEPDGRRSLGIDRFHLDRHQHGGIRHQSELFQFLSSQESVKAGIDIGPAYRLWRYAWSARLPLSILSDFEEFAVHDCQTRPAPRDKASTALLTFS